MREKKSSGHQRHEAALRFDSHIEYGCEASVKIGLETVHELVAKHHQENSYSFGQRAIARLLQKHVDDAVNTWLTKLSQPSLSFSKLLTSEGSAGTLYFDRLFEKIEKSIGWEVIITYPDLAPTASSLVTFGFFFAAHVSDNVEVVAFITEKEPGKPSSTSIDVRRTKRRDIKAKATKRALRVEFDFSSTGSENRYCQLCASLTEQASEILRINSHPEEISFISDRARELLKTPWMRLQTKNYSHEYCAKHSPEQSPVEYKRALGRRVEYFATRRFMILVRQAMGSAGLPHLTILRNASFRIANECPEQSLIQALPDMLEQWYDYRNENDEEPPDDHFLEHMQRILTSFKGADHPFTEFVNTFANKHVSHLYDSAKTHNIITDQEEQLASSGFIFDPYLVALANGGTILSFEPDATDPDPDTDA